MEQYRVLLADDEAEIRQGISRKIDWAAQGFVLAGEAENGAEALELAEQIRPDVVLTDIKMPFMDGLELCRRLRRELPAAKLVVFSGFDDFEYARQAVSMGVSEYIMKPVNARELEEVLAGLRTQLEAQRQQRRDMEALRRRYEGAVLRPPAGRAHPPGPAERAGRPLRTGTARRPLGRGDGADGSARRGRERRAGRTAAFVGALLSGRAVRAARLLAAHPALQRRGGPAGGA